MRSNNKSLLRTLLSMVLVLCLIASNGAFLVFAADGSLQEQVNAAANGDVIKLTADFNQQLTIPAGKVITLDLAGFDIAPANFTSANGAIVNNGTLTVIDSVGGGTVSATASGGAHAYGIHNKSGATLTVSSGIIKAHTNGTGYGSAIQNEGTIKEISGGDFIGTNNGEQFGYGIRNESSGVIELISDGWFYAAMTGPQNSGMNCVAMNNNGGRINMISGGIFYADVRSGGHAAGLRTGNTNVTLSGGAFFGRISGQNTYNSSAAILTNGYSSPSYSGGTTLVANPHGASVVMSGVNDYVVLTDEMEVPVAVYVFNPSGELVSKWGHTAESYEIYSGDETVTVTEAELADYPNETLYVNTGDDRQVLMFLGSSVTYGSAANSNAYGDFLELNHGYISNKRAISGTSLVDQGDGNGYVQRMVNQISPNAKIDKLIVQLSTNDAGQNKPLGAVSESTDLADFDRTTVIGAIEYIIAYAYETWGCDVIFWTNPKYDNANYEKMYNALFEIQTKWPDLGIMDFYSLGYPDGSLMNDSVHPKLEGYRDWMTPYAAEWLADYDNPVVDPEKVAAMIEMIEALGDDVNSTPAFLAQIEAVRAAYNDLTMGEKREVGSENTAKMTAAYNAYCELLATENGGKSVYIDFEDGTAGDQNGYITPIVGSKVEIVDDGVDGEKSASFTNVTNDYDYLISWKMDEYDPWVHATKGTAISMNVKLDQNIENNAVLFNYSFFGFRFFLRYVNDGLTVSARYEDGAGTSEFNVPGLGAYKGQWVNILVTSDNDGLYTVYFNGERVGSKKLTFSIYDIATYASKTSKRNQNEAYTGYYSIGGAAYWAADANSGVTSPFFSGLVDDFAIYNRSFSDYEAAEMFNELNLRKVDNALEVTPISGPGSGGESFEKMFDGLIGTKFGNSNHTQPFIWKVDEAVTARYYAMTTGGDSAQWTGRNPKTWTLSGATAADYQANTWTVIDAKTGYTGLADVNSHEYVFEIPADKVGAYEYYKIEFTNHSTWLQLDEFSLYVEIDAADAAAAKAVDDMIAALGEVTSAEQKADVVAARAAYDALTPAQKSLVEKLDGLVAAEAVIKDFDDLAAAKAVDDMIVALGEITSLDQQDDVEAARAAYDALSDVQKDLVEKYDDLLVAEDAILALTSIGADDPEKVQVAITAIEAIGEVTYKSLKLITVAEDAWNALTENDQIRFAAQGKVLEDAKADFEAIIEAFDWKITENRPSANDKVTLNNWLVTASDDVWNATRADLADSVKYAYYRGRNVGFTAGGTSNGFDAWMTDARLGGWYHLPMGTDNDDNYANQDWKGHFTVLSTVFPGIGFAVDTSFAQQYSFEHAAAIGESFEWNGKTYQVFWENSRSYTSIEPVGGSKASPAVSIITNKPDERLIDTEAQKNIFRYAYAKYSQENRWDGLTLGVPQSAFATAGGVNRYQLFDGPQGVAYLVTTEDKIAAAPTDKAADTYAAQMDESYFVITGKLAEVIADDPTVFETAGAILAVSDTQITFAAGVLTEDGFTVNTEAAEDAAEVDEIIVALGEITSLDQKADVEAARAAYEALDAAGKALVTKLADLEAAEGVIAALEKAAADAAAAKAVDDMIGALGEITSLDQEEAVVAARAAYDALTTAQKDLVTKLNALKEAEAAIDAIKNPEVSEPTGDVDMNKTVDVADIMKLKALIMADKWSADELAIGDMDGSKKLDVGDIMAVKNIIMSK